MSMPSLNHVSAIKGLQEKFYQGRRRPIPGPLAVADTD